MRIEKAKELLKYIDVLIDGEYDFLKKENNRRWIGSTNQKYTFLLIDIV